MRLRIPSFLPQVLIHFIALLTLLALPGACRAYCPVPEIRASGEYFKGDAVFVGAVVSIRKKPDSDRDLGGWFYHLRVEKTFRGQVQDNLQVYTEDSDIRFPLEINHKYLLFAYRRRGRLEIDNCGNSALLSQAADSLRRLERLTQGQSPTVIEGWVVAETGGIDVSGVRVSIRGRSKVYSAITDKEGWFHFQVPPGSYKTDFTSKGYYLNGADEFWYDSEHFVVHAGECASLQFVSVRHLIK
jgi:Carboxypeptidase regulatory-like domain